MSIYSPTDQTSRSGPIFNPLVVTIVVEDEKRGGGCWRPEMKFCRGHVGKGDEPWFTKNRHVHPFYGLTTCF